MIEKHKDKKLRLAYVDLAQGVPISIIPRFFHDDATGASQVIAARAGPTGAFSVGSLSNPPDNTLAIRINKNDPTRVKSFKEVYDYFCSIAHTGKAVEFLDINPEHRETILQQFVDLQEATVRRVLVLARSDGKPVERNPAEWACHLVKEGGSELVVDFLLSRFCRHQRYGWARTRDPSVKLFPEDEFQQFSTVAPGEDEANYQRICEYDFSNQFTFDDLIQHEKEFDIDQNLWLPSSEDFYYYSVNLEALKHLNDEIKVPFRVLEILTPQQRERLDSEVPQILLSQLSYIYTRVFRKWSDHYHADLVQDLLKTALKASSDRHKLLKAKTGRQSP